LRLCAGGDGGGDGAMSYEELSRRIFKLIPEDKVEAITLVYRMFYLEEELSRNLQLQNC
jgi:hypothetical protein